MNEKIKYDNHELEWEKVINDSERNKVALTWLKQSSTLNTWRHDRVYNCLKPIIEYDKKIRWVTIGDGRYGTDANALFRLGAKHVMATDISDKLLKIGNEKGFIKDYSAQNAEKLSFESDQFDFALCKEAYHHFPRPHIALHEMLRVSKLGVVLCEPLDPFIKPKLLNRFIPLIKRLIGRASSNEGHSFETVGNYVFSVSERELEKVQLGMHRRHLAYKYLNDYYQPGYEFISLDSNKKSDIRAIRTSRRLIKIRDILSNFKLISAGSLIAILFKSEPDPRLLQSLKKSGWLLKKLPHNPYI